MFAKLFQCGPCQVVVMKDYDTNDDTDEPIDILWLLTNIEGTLMQMRLGFKSEKMRDKAFREYDQEAANKFVNDAINKLT